MRIRVNTTVSKEEYDDIHKYNWKIPELIALGIACKVKPDVLQERLNEQQQVIDSLKKATQHLRTKVAQLERR